MPDEQFLRLPDVIRKVTLSKAQIYREIAENKFPRQIRLSKRVVVWKKSDLEEWMQNVH